MQQLLVLDAMPIIHLLKTSFKGILEKLGVKLISTSKVKEEIFGQYFPDRPLLIEAFEKLVSVEDPKKPARIHGVGAGEASAIALALEKKCPLVSDDATAREAAKALGVPLWHTTYLIFRALQKGLIGKLNAEELVKELIESGWWCDSAALLHIMEKIRNSSR